MQWFLSRCSFNLVCGQMVGWCTRKQQRGDAPRRGAAQVSAVLSWAAEVWLPVQQLVRWVMHQGARGPDWPPLAVGLRRSALSWSIEWLIRDKPV